jgi:SAM-dependent methyltransferase
MKFMDYVKWIIKGEAGVFLRLSRDLKGCYRVLFLSHAGKTGFLRALSSEPLTFQGLMNAIPLAPENAPRLKAFLNLGQTLGEIGLNSGRYHLKGKLSRALSREKFDPYLALTEEASGLHVPYIGSAINSDNDGSQLVELSDAHSEVIARASRVAEPVLKSVMDQLIPRSGPFELLEIGSGSGVYLLHALASNPVLRATGVERVPSVAQALTEKLGHSGLASRAEILATDMRSLEFANRFDCITLFNNIYYFPESEHEALLAKLLTWLKPGGRLAIATLCRGGKYPIDAILHLWSAMTPGASVLVEPEAFITLMGTVGFFSEIVTPSFIDPALKVFIGQKPCDE